jgi:hypothetical protein
MLDRVDADERVIVERYISAGPVRVGELALALGLEVIRTPLAPRISGLIQPSAKSRAGYEIKVNKYEVPERQRFTVAHELGHFLLHKREIGNGVIDSIMYRSSLTSKKEAEANKLAADIIMPAALVTAALRDLGGALTSEVVKELAAMFRVSIPAMKVRLGVD